MTNHPNRSKRSHTVTIVRDSATGITTEVIGIDLSRQKAFDAAKRAAGKGAEFTGRYGPTSYAYVGQNVTAVVSWF